MINLGLRQSERDRIAPIRKLSKGIDLAPRRPVRSPKPSVVINEHRESAGGEERSVVIDLLFDTGESMRHNDSGRSSIRRMKKTAEMRAVGSRKCHAAPSRAQRKKAFVAIRTVIITPPRPKIALR